MLHTRLTDGIIVMSSDQAMCLSPVRPQFTLLKSVIVLSPALASLCVITTIQELIVYTR